MNTVQEKINLAKQAVLDEGDENAFGRPIAKAETKGGVRLLAFLTDLLHNHVRVEILEEDEKLSNSEPFTE